MPLQQTRFTAASKSLENIDQSLFPQLGEVIWSWKICPECLCSKTCVTNSCPSRRTAQLSRYFHFYRAVVSNYIDHSPAGNRILGTHGELWYAIQALKLHPELTRAELCQALLSKRQGNMTSPNDSDLLHATTLVVKLLMMIDCSALHFSSDQLEKGCCRIHWEDDVPFTKYLQDLFPPGNHPLLSYPDNDLLADIKSDLKARKLKKHLGVTLRATDDIQNHLRLHRRQNVIEIFHHTAFIKEQLRLTKGPGDWSSPSSTIKAGALPRQLALEVLDSLQMVLFPLSDPQSKQLLQSLVSNGLFDRDILHFEFTSIRRVGEESVSYVYFADRLSELYNELHNPRPRGWLDRQMERKSSARHMMMATLFGVLFAIFLGILSLIVTSYQTWIAYQAWQHPLQPLSSPK
ncbi:hypothetical protein DM02DRAFT_699980 [Periconia macrospinosa]|uniref:Uncharacterized protein n=1 Tax=Periconia macrospinosa TaxID=97972 RepID=A0A2V1D337_9PLEO|nr:hypothetical protein DM02DRAFT_699980 [Periconia macrospinosa]